MEYRLSEGVLVIEPGEEIDHHQAKMIIHLAESLMAQRRVMQLIFDMRHTSFMDSAGVGMMIGLYREMKMYHGTVGMVHMQPSIFRIYKMAGLSKIIISYDQEVSVSMKMGDEKDER